MIGHFKSQFAFLFPEYFKNNDCIKCHKSGLRFDSFKARHLLFIHNELRKEIEHQVQTTLKQQQFPDNMDSVKTAETNGEKEENTMLLQK